MGDTIPGSSLVGPAFGTSTEVVSVTFDRVRIRLVSWNYVADTLLSGDIPSASSGMSEWRFIADGDPGVWINVRTCFSRPSEYLGA